MVNWNDVTFWFCVGFVVLWCINTLRDAMQDDADTRRKIEWMENRIAELEGSEHRDRH